MFPTPEFLLKSDLYNGQIADPTKRDFGSTVGTKRFSPPFKMTDPGASCVFSAIATVVRFVDFVSSLKEVSSENRIFISLIQRVREDIDEASRLRRCPAVTTHFIAYPSKKSWVDNAILDVQRALNEIGLYVESAMVDDNAHGGIKMKQRFEWVLSHHQKLITREISLSTYHQSVMGAINAMQAIEMGGGLGGSGASGPAPPTYQLPGQQWVDPKDDDILRSPFARKKAVKLHAKNEQMINSTTEPATVMSVELPAEVLPRDGLQPKVSLRGSSGYFPSLPDLDQSQGRYHELPGSFPSSSPQPVYQAYRPPVTLEYKALPALPRQSSLRSELAKWLGPWDDTQNDEILTSELEENITPTSENLFTPTSDGKSDCSAPSPNTEVIEELVQKSATQERRRKMHTRRLAAAYDD
ncbi:hypothetical protein K432DRAFT_64391 [Lepidopterella palustris CBS 459.81]|uniref:Uncharacterized protein n=1 Tax=Lepidopterella palustris CBS 459.81 TaxID=1314670 RepID=A0A8E2JEC8_9PEZI|nr:hypothetical protein K432DRAFT_64391 [Lepidopterella palustris CBS 459.81]